MKHEPHDTWLEDRGIEAMVDEVVELSSSIGRGHRSGTMSEEQVIECGDRQAVLVHKLLQCCDSPADVAKLVEELDMNISVLMSLNTLHLASVDRERIANPAFN